ncbi:MAG: helix-turn-helix transcriptional regulator [Oceanicaulis sp.]
MSDLASVRDFHDALARGEEELLPDAVVGRLLDGESPVRVWREHRGQSLRGLARLAGLSAAYLSEIESGVKSPSVRTLQALATALGVSLDDLAPAPAPAG